MMFLSFYSRCTILSGARYITNNFPSNKIIFTVDSKLDHKVGCAYYSTEQTYLVYELFSTSSVFTVKFLLFLKLLILSFLVLFTILRVLNQKVLYKLSSWKYKSRRYSKGSYNSITSYTAYYKSNFSSVIYLIFLCQWEEE